MPISEFAAAYHEKMFPGYQSDFLRNDPEFIERFDNFALSLNALACVNKAAETESSAFRSK